MKATSLEVQEIVTVSRKLADALMFQEQTVSAGDRFSFMGWSVQYVEQGPSDNRFTFYRVWSRVDQMDLGIHNKTSMVAFFTRMYLLNPWKYPNLLD